MPGAGGRAGRWSWSPVGSFRSANTPRRRKADTLVPRQIDTHPASASAVFERLANFVRVAMEGTGETDSMAEGVGTRSASPSPGDIDPAVVKDKQVTPGPGVVFGDRSPISACLVVASAALTRGFFEQPTKFKLCVTSLRPHPFGRAWSSHRGSGIRRRPRTYQRCRLPGRSDVDPRKSAQRRALPPRNR
jgi:hypothetical protein